MQINCYYVPCKLQISFKNWLTPEELRIFKEQNGLPQYIPPSYTGYTGPKLFNFPITPYLNFINYPDLTQNLEQFKNECCKEVDQIKTKYPFTWLPKILKLFLVNFPTANIWDTKYIPDFPGRDEFGCTQYAIYKGKIVSANYLSNNIYAQIVCHSGLPLWVAKFAARLDARSVTEAIRYRRIPNKKARKFRDTREDQQAIESGYYDYKSGDPWQDPEIDPKRPYPKTNKRQVVKTILVV